MNSIILVVIAVGILLMVWSLFVGAIKLVLLIGLVVFIAGIVKLMGP